MDPVLLASSSGMHVTGPLPQKEAIVWPCEAPGRLRYLQRWRAFVSVRFVGSRGTSRDEALVRPESEDRDEDLQPEPSQRPIPIRGLERRDPT